MLSSIFLGGVTLWGGSPGKGYKTYYGLNFAHLQAQLEKNGENFEKKCAKKYPGPYFQGTLPQK